MSGTIYSLQLSCDIETLSDHIHFYLPSRISSLLAVTARGRAKDSSEEEEFVDAPTHAPGTSAVHEAEEPSEASSTPGGTSWSLTNIATLRARGLALEVFRRFIRDEGTASRPSTHISTNPFEFCYFRTGINPVHHSNAHVE